jgi:hypothetical protein
MKHGVAADLKITLDTPYRRELCLYCLYMQTDGDGSIIANQSEKQLAGAYNRLRAQGLSKRSDKVKLPSTMELSWMARSGLDDARDAAVAVLNGCLDEDSLTFLMYACMAWRAAGRPVYGNGIIPDAA